MEETKKRLRSTADDKIASKEDADKRLAVMRSRRRRQQDVIDEFRVNISTHLKIAYLEFDKLQAEIKAEFRVLETFWQGQRKLEKKKSIQLNNGKIGTRVVGGGWIMPPDAELIVLLKKLKRKDLIITIEKPDKTAIKDPENKPLHKKLGMERKPSEDKFFVQTEGDQVEQFVKVFSMLSEQVEEPEEVA